MIKKKIIGITTYNLHREADLLYFVNSTYINSYLKIFEKYNIGVIFLPPYIQMIDHYLEICDGIIVNGNDKHIDPNLYGEERSPHIKPSEICKNRCFFELELVKKCVKINKPLLGICGGMQTLNVCLGGTLTQYIPAEYSNSLNHAQSKYKKSWAHRVKISPNTLLSKIVNKDEILTNTSHIQAVKKIGNGLIVNAISAADGVPEGIEFPQNKFCLGVQWHPEFNVQSSDFAIFERLAQSLLS